MDIVKFFKYGGLQVVWLLKDFCFDMVEVCICCYGVVVIFELML